jgi:Raf kinase inhibitor-like YbhB/YbcL family protein
MIRLAALLICTALAACATAPGGGPPAAGNSAFTLWTPGLKDGAILDLAYSGNIASNPNCLGQNRAPALAWANVPAGAKSLAIIVHDQQGRNGLGAAHWVAYGIDPATSGFAENEIGVPSAKVVAGKSTLNTPTYFGPCPPANTGLHYYQFTVIATDLDRDALPPGLSLAELLARLEGGRARAAASTVLRFGR